MKICMIELIQKGGMVHYASQLSSALANLKNTDVHMVVPDGINECIFDQRVHLIKIPSIGRHGYRIDLVLRHILKINPEVIHITLLHPFLIPILPVLKKYPSVVTTHEVRPHPGDSVLITKLITQTKKKYANINVVHSKSIKEDLILCGFDETNIKVIPHGDYSFFSRISTNEISEEENTILFFGRILDYKGIEYLIKSEPLISSKISNFKIIIAGNGDFSTYENMVSNNNHFEIINQYIPDEKVPELFQKASAVVLPYIEASQTGIIPIAYAFKKPVVATDVGSLSEVVVDGVTGFLIPPKDSKSLADSLLKILLDKGLKNSMGNAAYEFMKKNMSWKEIAQKTVEEYQKLVISKNIDHYYNIHPKRGLL